jgi:hypothetical protein
MWHERYSIDLIQHVAGRIQYSYRSDSISGRRIQFRSDPIGGRKATVQICSNIWQEGYSIDLIQHVAGRIQYSYRSDPIGGRKDTV